MFNRFFNKIDINQDGMISRKEMTSFIKQFLDTPSDLIGDSVPNDISRMIQKAWFEYDLDRNGYLDKRETFRFLNDILSDQGQPQATLSMFNRFFNEFDINQDGVISKGEMARFFRKFMGVPDRRPSPQRTQRSFLDDTSALVN